MTVFESIMITIAFASLVIAIMSFNHIEKHTDWRALRRRQRCSFS